MLVTILSFASTESPSARAQDDPAGRPATVHDKQGVDDPHDNPSLAIDEHGHLWVFVSGRGRRRPGFIYRGTDPYSTDAFEQIFEGEFSYPQPHPVAGQGIVHLQTTYTRGRELYVTTSGDGRGRSDAVKLAGMGGHYQTSNVDGDRVITAFNMHPGGNVDLRTNLYYVESRDFGKTWQTADGNPDELSPSRLYLTNRAGTDVWQLPYDIEGDRARPRPAERPRP